MGESEKNECKEIAENVADQIAKQFAMPGFRKDAIAQIQADIEAWLIYVQSRERHKWQAEIARLRNAIDSIGDDLNKVIATANALLPKGRTNGK